MSLEMCIRDSYYVYQNTPYDLGAISKVEHEEE